MMGTFRRRIGVFVLVAAFFAASCAGGGASEREIEVTWTEVGVIGKEGASAEELLGNPIDVVARAGGQVFVLDGQAQQIKSYGPGGQFRHALGGPGEGPGEFELARALVLDSAGRLHVYDRRRRRATVFDPGSTEVIAVHEVPGWLERIVPVGRELLLTGVDSAPAEEIRYVARMVDRSYETTGDRIGEVEALIDSTDPIARRSLDGPVLFEQVGEERTLFLAPLYYDGEIFVFESINDEPWRPQPSLQGYDLAGEPYTTISEEELEELDPESVHHLSVTPSGRVMARVHSWSAGLFRHDGYLLHFYCRSEQGEEAYAFGVEIFSPEGRFLGHRALGPVKEVTRRGPPVVRWKDETGRYYVTDPEAALVRIFELELSTPS